MVSLNVGIFITQKPNGTRATALLLFLLAEAFDRLTMKRVTMIMQQALCQKRALGCVKVAPARL